MNKIKDRKIVIVNQAVNYLTIGICNEFATRFEEVSLITGGIHVQGEELNKEISIDYILPWKEEHGWGKMIIYIKALWAIFYKLKWKYKDFEVFFVSVPPMAYLLNILLPNRFSMLIWDVYPDVLKITGMKETHPVYKIWVNLNKKSFKKAYKLFTIGENMADLLSQYVKKEKILIQPIWSVFQKNERLDKQSNPFIKEHQLEDKFIVQYSGNIGLTHKVEIMIALAEKMQAYPNILFQIIGRGPRKKHLEQLVLEKKLSNCRFLPFQTDDMFPYSLSAADLGVVILDDLTAKGSVPSKSYNLMSFGIPSLYIASDDSELAAYAIKYGHAACFSEQNLMDAQNFILDLYQNKTERDRYSQNALLAAGNFKRNNAEKLIAAYLA